MTSAFLLSCLLAVIAAVMASPSTAPATTAATSAPLAMSKFACLPKPDIKIMSGRVYCEVMVCVPALLMYPDCEKQCNENPNCAYQLRSSTGIQHTPDTAKIVMGVLLGLTALFAIVFVCLNTRKNKKAVDDIEAAELVEK